MRKNSWIWIAAGWFFIVRISEYYALRSDLGRELTWEGSLRYIVVELGFWLIMTPVIAWWVNKFPLERPALVRNVAILLALNVATELLYSSYRVKLHHFVYPDFPLRSFWRQSQTYLIDNSVIVAWLFWASLQTALCGEHSSTPRTNA